MMKFMTEDEFTEKKKSLEETEAIIRGGIRTVFPGGTLGYSESSAIFPAGNLIFTESEIRALADALRDHRVLLESQLTHEERKRSSESHYAWLAREEKRQAERVAAAVSESS